MVYDLTIHPAPDRSSGECGFAIHETTELERLTRDSEPIYTLYTDDGRGNGDYVCGTDDLYWARRIAHALDADESRIG